MAFDGNTSCHRLIARSAIGTAIVAVASIAIAFVAAGDAPDPKLRVVIIRHAEKPDDGDNLSCKGMNRALQLPAVLHAKFQTPDHVYVPTLDCGKSTNHARMFQTITPFAAKYNLKINSAFDEKDVSSVASSVLKRKGTVLLVWEHSQIQPLAKALGADDPPKWKEDEFDRIWILTYPHGTAKLSFDDQGISPMTDCSF